MDFRSPTKLFSFSHFFVVVFLITSSSLVVAELSDNTALVKCCSEEELSDPDAEQALSALFESLVSQSSKTNFFQTTSKTGQTSITGLFQCRGDLSTSDCYNCVSQLPQLSHILCGKSTSSSIHLYGCHIFYDIADFAQISGMKVVYRTCSIRTWFEERRDTSSSSSPFPSSSSGKKVAIILGAIVAFRFVGLCMLIVKICERKS